MNKEKLNEQFGKKDGVINQLFGGQQPIPDINQVNEENINQAYDFINEQRKRIQQLEAEKKELDNLMLEGVKAFKKKRDECERLKAELANLRQSDGVFTEDEMNLIRWVLNEQELTHAGDLKRQSIVAKINAIEAENL